MRIADRRRLRELISSMCDRTLLAEEYRDLDELVLSSDEAAEYAVRLLEINAEMSHQASSLLNPVCCDEALDDDYISHSDKTVGGSWSDSGVSWPSFITAATIIAILASSVTWYLAGGQQELAGNLPKHQGVVLEESPVKVEPRTDYVARIVRKIDCDLQDDRWGLGAGLNIFPDQTLAIQQGLMELEFTSGARITLEGPATFTAVSPMSAVLLHGQLTANVPKQARGFQVETPSGQTIDLGTRFGLTVDARGDTETHVFEGEVIVKDNVLEEGASEEILLTENMAYKFASASSPSQNLTAKPQRFVQLGFNEQHTAPFDEPAITEDLTLWLTSQAQVQTDSSDRVSGWGNAMQGARDEIVAWQVRETNRPTIVSGAIGDKPGLFFDGTSYLVTDPLKMEGSSSFCVVFSLDSEKLSKRRTSWPQGFQILNGNGPSTMVMKLNKKMHVSAYMYAGVTLKGGAEKHKYSGVTWSSALADQVPHVAVYVNDGMNGLGRLYIDGKKVAENVCNVAKSTNVPRFIGSHNLMSQPRFVGYVAELMFYNQGLRHEDALVLSKSLLEKYSVPAE